MPLMAQPVSRICFCSIFVPFRILPIITAVVDDTGLLESEFALVFPAGSIESTLCTSIPIVNDTLLEGTHDFSVTITDAGAHALISSSSSVTTVIIIEGDSKSDLLFSYFPRVMLQHLVYSW